MVESLSTARIPDGTPRGLVQVGLPFSGHQSTPGRSDPPVKPTSEVAYQPGQQPAMQAVRRIAAPGAADPYTSARSPFGCEPSQPRRQHSPGSAEECSAERSRAPRDNGGARGGTRLGNPCDEDGLTR